MNTAIGNPRALARLSGLFYLGIIVTGLTAELAIRSALIDISDAAATAENIRGSRGLFLAGIGADALMATLDIALAILLYALLKPVSALISLAAMVLRLVQAVIIAVNLINPYAALMLVTGGWAVSGGTEGAEVAALFHLTLHAHGYDLGLFFFGINALLTGWLVIRSTFLPALLGWLIVAAGIVYLTGSTLRFGAPDAFAAFQPAYFVCIVAELAFAVWLLLRGVNETAWRQRAGANRP